MTEKARSLAYQTMCLFYDFDTTTKRGIELAEDEWDTRGDKWMEVVLSLREDIVTVPPKQPERSINGDDYGTFFPGFPS